MKNLSKLYRSVYKFIDDHTVEYRVSADFWRTVIWKKGAVIIPNQFEITNWPAPLPNRIKKPAYYISSDDVHPICGKAEIQKPSVIAAMRKTCRLAADILRKCPQILQPGVTTDELNQFVHNEIIRASAYPSPLRYLGYPKSIATSPNNIVCNGVPNLRPLEDGDILSVDVTVFANGVHGSCARTFGIGNVNEKNEHLTEMAELCLDEAVNVCAPGVPFKEIGITVERIADECNLRVVPDVTGFGIGTYHQCPPIIYHIENDYGGEMAAGMIFTIEPTLVTGSPVTFDFPDGWTTATIDHSRAAHFRHTVLVTDDGCEVLTTPD